MTKHHRWLSRPLSVAFLVGIAALNLGCEDPKVPPQPVPGSEPGQQGWPGVPAPVPGAPGPVQYGVSEGSLDMNATAAAHYNQGMAFWAQGDMKQAQASLQQAVQADPEAHQAWYSLGVVQERLDSPSAAKSYEKSFTVKDDYERGMVAYALYQARHGKLSEADSFLTKKRAARPKSAALTAALAEVKSLQKDSAGAQDLAQEALKIDPSFAPAMMTIARDYYRARQLDLSLYALQAVLDGTGPDNPPRDPQNAEAHLLRAVIWAEQDKRPLAMEAFKTAVDLRPDLVVASVKLATYLLESGAADQALPILQKALQYDDDNVAAHLSLGDAHRLLGNYPQAKSEFEYVKSRDASMPAVHYNLGLLYMLADNFPGMTKKAQVEAAIAAFEKFKEVSPKGERSDVDELLNRLNLKKAEIEAIEAAKNPQPVPAPPPPPAEGDAGDEGGDGDGG